MNWSDKCRYKVQGERKELSDDTVYFFYLDQCEIIFEKKKKTQAEVLAEPPGVSMPPEEQAERQEAEQGLGVKPFYPDDWGSSFGVPVDEERTLDIEKILSSNSFVSIKLDQGD